MRLIDVCALIKEMQDILDEKSYEKGTLAYSIFELFIKRLKEEPTVDAAPVVHGEWIEHYAFGCFHYDCSICDDGFAIKNKQKELPNYCHNCGAKMDGGNTP